MSHAQVLKKTCSEQNMMYLNKFDDLINDVRSIRDVSGLVYNFDILSEDSLLFIKSIRNIKKFNTPIILYINKSVDNKYIKALQDIGIDLVITSEMSDNFANDEITRIISVISNGKAQNTNISSSKNYIIGCDERRSVMPIINEWARSKRKKLLVEGLAEGLGNEDIVLKSSLSIGTVRNYISQLTSLTGLKNRTKLAIYIKEQMDLA